LALRRGAGKSGVGLRLGYRPGRRCWQGCARERIDESLRRLVGGDGHLWRLVTEAGSGSCDGRRGVTKRAPAGKEAAGCACCVVRRRSTEVASARRGGRRSAGGSAGAPPAAPFWAGHRFRRHRLAHDLFSRRRRRHDDPHVQRRGDAGLTRLRSPAFPPRRAGAHARARRARPRRAGRASGYAGASGSGAPDRVRPKGTGTACICSVDNRAPPFTHSPPAPPR
jgi:hypothetical protein